MPSGKQLYARRLIAGLALATVCGLALTAVADEPQPANQQPPLRVAKIKATTWSVDPNRKQTLANTQIAFQPGQPADLKIGGIKSGDTTSSIEIKVHSRVDQQPMQHLIEAKIREQIGVAEPSILAAPKLLVQDGKPASISIQYPQGTSLEIELLVESVK